MPLPSGAQGVLVQGDSELVIGFLTGAAKPGKPSFFLAIKSLRAQLRRLPYPIIFQHIPRAENTLADWLTNVPRAVQCDVNVSMIAPELCIGDEPPWPATDAALRLAATDNLNYVAIGRASERDRCPRCSELARGMEARKCGICLHHFHLRCCG